MNQRVIPGINPDMSTVAHKVSRLYVGEAHGIAGAPLRRGIPRQTDAECTVDALHKPRTVRAVRQTGSPVDVGVAEELPRVIHHRLPV